MKAFSEGYPVIALPFLTAAERRFVELQLLVRAGNDNNKICKYCQQKMAGETGNGA